MKRICLLVLVLVLAMPCMTGTTAETTHPTLQLKSRGDAVVRLQTRLIDLGLLTGKADGIYGSGTEKAVVAFQTYLQTRGYKVEADGVANEKTQTLLYDDECTKHILDLSVGDQGAAVAKLQRRLYELNFLQDIPDGGFGAKTQDALRAFQTVLVAKGVKGASVTGVADSVTREMLYSDSLSGFGIIAPEFFDESDPLSLEEGHLYAHACMLMDADSGEVLFQKNADQKMYPASTTKIMTLLLALEKGKTGRTVTIPQSATEIPADSSVVPVYFGEKMTLNDLLYGMVIRSGNDAANAVATLESGTVAKFVIAMNAKAKALGMKGTHFVNPHGYHDPDHYTTARDMATLTRYALENKAFRKIVSTRSYTMAATEKRKELALQNKYSILDPASEWYDPDAFGIKTGYTSKAGQCYVGAAQRDGKTLIAVVFQSGLSKTDKWVDAANLFEYGFAALEAADAA